MLWCFILSIEIIKPKYKTSNIKTIDVYNFLLSLVFSVFERFSKTMLNTQREINLYEDDNNPLNVVEEILLNNDWHFDRLSDNRLSVVVSGEYAHHTMNFFWQEEYQAMQFCCTTDVVVLPQRFDEAAKMVNKINSGLWLGHFDVCQDHDDPMRYIPCFRHTTLMRGQDAGTSLPVVEDLIDVAIHECERHYTAFSLLETLTTHASDNMDLALMDAVGRS